MVANHLNAIFRVDTADGRTYALRVSHPTWRTAEDMAMELLWLQAIHRDTGLCVPVPFATRDGTLTGEVTVAGAPEPRRCAVTGWISGVDLAERLSEDNVHKLGVLSARLHEHAAGFRPPTGFSARTMDGVYARGEPDVLFDDDHRDLFTPTSRAVFAEVAERVRAAFAALYADPRGLRLIHNDLHHENAKVFRGRLCPLDFEDTLWGYPVQDVAMTFFDLLDYTDPARADYRALCAAFEHGYASILPWPEAYPGQIDAFIAGRQLWRANWVVRFEREHAPGFVARMAPRFEAFLASGSFPPWPPG